MQISEVMHKGIVCVNRNDSIRRAAELMKSEDVGALPVLEQDRPVGFVTDRDIVISCVAEGGDFNAPVEKAMTENIVSITEEKDVEEASRLMQENKVSRILVVDKDNHPVGMVSLKDLSLEDEDLSAETVTRIKQ